MLRARRERALGGALPAAGLPGSGSGLAGSAIANVVAQTVGGALFLRALVARAGAAARRSPAVLRRQLVGQPRPAASGARRSRPASCPRPRWRPGSAPAALGAHQIALQLWFFCALALDAVAIAAQSLVGAALGAGDAAAARRVGPAGSPRSAACCGRRRSPSLIGAGAGGAARRCSPTDPAVREQALIAWPWFVAHAAARRRGLRPRRRAHRRRRRARSCATSRWSRRSAASCRLIWLAYALELGLGGVWAGLTLFMVVRLVGMLLRVRTGGWAGAVRQSGAG